MIKRSDTSPIYKKLHKIYDEIYSLVANDPPPNLILYLPCVENKEPIEGQAEIRGTQRFKYLNRYLLHRSYLKRLQRTHKPVRQINLFKE